jgi:putative acetyltransferase
MLRITDADLGDPRIVAMLRQHRSRALTESGPDSCHALDVQALRAADVRLWAAWEEDTLAGVGALKALSLAHGEVKSMYTAEDLRGRGVGSAMLRHILAEARRAGMQRLSLETGTLNYFDSARALYRRHGFIDCPPFADYREDPNSAYMSRDLGRPGAEPG